MLLMHRQGSAHNGIHRAPPVGLDLPEACPAQSSLRYEASI